MALWLQGRSPQTMRAYRRDGERLLSFTGKPLREITLADLQRFDTSLADLAESSRASILSAVKSLFSFASKTFPAPFPVNVGAALRLPKRKDTLAERILHESAVQKMLAKEDHPRNRLILLLLYAAGSRRAELCGLCWRDVQERELADGTLTGQLVAFGKGGKTRPILLTPEIRANSRVCAVRRPMMSRCLCPASAAKRMAGKPSSPPRSTILCARLHGAPTSRSQSVRIGCDMPTPATR